MSQGTTPNSSTTEDDGLCRLCGAADNLCGGLGMVRYDVPVGDPHFGKLHRCPNNPAEQDLSWQQRLRRLSNISAFADKTLDNYEIDLAMHGEAERESLTLALDAARNFANHMDGWLLFEGSYGTGKTHLAAAIGNIRLQLGDAVLFITVPDLLDHLRAAYGPTSEMGYDETFERVRNADLLILDDLGVENPSAWAQEKLFQLLNHRYSHEMPTVITTNVDIDTLDPRIRSRLLDIGLIRRVKVNAPDYRSLVQNAQTQLQSNLSLYQDMTFNTFDTYNHVYPDERDNLERVWRVAQSYAEAPQGWLLILGGHGTGKTHIAAAIAQHRRDMGEEVMFLTVPDLLDYLRTAYSPNAPVNFDQRFTTVKNVPLLIMDDLGTENASPWAKEKLFQLIDYRYVAKLPTVITTARQLKEIDERTQVRLKDDRRCVTYAITARAYALRRRQS